MKNLNKKLLEKFKEQGIEPIVQKPISKKQKAKELRKEYIHFYKHHPINSFCHCYEEEKQDAKYNLMAYEQMTDKQILMSEELYWKNHHKDFQELLDDYHE